MSNQSKLACNLALVKAGFFIWAGAAVRNSLSSTRRAFKNGLGIRILKSLGKMARYVSFMLIIVFLIFEAMYLPGLVSVLLTDDTIRFQNVSLIIFNAEPELLEVAVDKSMPFCAWLIRCGCVGLFAFLSIRHFCDLGKASVAASAPITNSEGS